VVAPTYRRREGLPRFVEPLLREPDLHELVMAVDGSDDGSVEWLRERSRSDSRLVTLDLPNRGAGATRQAGIEAASGEVVVLLDDDVIAAPGLVAGHARHHRELAPKLVVGYMPNDWRRLPPGRRGIGYIYRRAYEGHCSRFDGDPGFVLRGLWGGNFSMPRGEFLRIGIVGLDVPRGQDDREFGLRCAKGGITGTFDRAIVGEHLYERTLEQFRGDCRLQGESRKLLHEAHGDVLGEELADDPTGEHVADAVGMGVPRRLRPAWRRLGDDPLFGAVIGMLTAAFRLGVVLRHLGLEVQSARAIGSIETMRGVIERS
jgi:glycosyltransferase involved in cell wall biosynthesis